MSPSRSFELKACSTAACTSVGFKSVIGPLPALLNVGAILPVRVATAHAEVMRLLVSSSDPAGGWRRFDVGGRDHVVDVGEELAGDVALEAADDLLFGASFGGAAGDVVLGGL